MLPALQEGPTGILNSHVHTCLVNVLGYKAMKAKLPREPVEDSGKELDQIWRLTCSFLQSSDHVRSGRLPADGGSQDTGLCPRNQCG